MLILVARGGAKRRRRFRACLGPYGGLINFSCRNSFASERPSASIRQLVDCRRRTGVTSLAGPLVRQQARRLPTRLASLTPHPGQPFAEWLRQFVASPVAELVDGQNRIGEAVRGVVCPALLAREG